jgi:hypothetical protein
MGTQSVHTLWKQWRGTGIHPLPTVHTVNGPTVHAVNPQTVHPVNGLCDYQRTTRRRPPITSQPTWHTRVPHLWTVDDEVEEGPSR